VPRLAQQGFVNFPSEVMCACGANLLGRSQDAAGEGIFCDNYILGSHMPPRAPQTHCNLQCVTS
jgi:hypothetical protein